MKKANLIVIMVFLIMVSQAVGYNIQIVPEHPTSCDVVVITLSGWWGDSCVPVGSTISVMDSNIYFDVSAHPPSSCLTVITPWSRTRSVGPLSPGTYTVYARIVGYPFIPETYTPMTEFTVTPEFHIDTVYYVDVATGNNNNDGLSKETAFATIQKGVDTAKSGDTIIVAEGTYTGDGNHDINFYCKAITVRSTDPNNPNIVANTVVDCHGTVSGFNFRSNEGPNSVLDGLTITNGRAGINCRDYSSPTINHCIITHNCAGSFSVGIGCNNSSPTIINCTISENSANYGRGIYACYHSNLTIIDCIIADNIGADHGGGIYCENSSPTIFNCTIRSNSAVFRGGGIYARSSSNLTLTNCIISDNTANSYCGGGLFSYGSSIVIANCTFSNNSAPNGNALAFDSWSLPYPSDVQLKNCILWDGGNEIWNDDGSTIRITYTDVWDGWAGEGNIDTAPCFVDPTNDDYHLLSNSPCINAGDPNYVAGPNETDLDGNRRVVAGRIDMGAYEFPNNLPVANPGPNQVAYAWIDRIAEVNLDGSASYDDDGDELTYLWRWSIDGNDYEANGISPAIEVPVGQHTIELVVNDGWKDSEPNYTVITVIGPIEGTLWITPQIIHRRCEQRRIMAMLRLPAGTTKDQIDSNSALLLYPGEVESVSQFILPYYANGVRRVCIFVFFDRDEILEAIGGNGPVQVYVVGQLKTGQYFYGSDIMRIINPGRRPTK